MLTLPKKVFSFQKGYRRTSRFNCLVPEPVKVQDFQFLTGRNRSYLVPNAQPGAGRRSVTSASRGEEWRCGEGRVLARGSPVRGNFQTHGVDQNEEEEQRDFGHKCLDFPVKSFCSFSSLTKRNEAPFSAARGLGLCPDSESCWQGSAPSV